MKRLAFLLVFSCLFLFACGQKNDLSLLAYQEKAFSADLSYERGGTVFSARATLSPGVDFATRSLSLCFTEPASLSSLTVTKQDGKTEATVGSVKLSQETLTALLSPLSLFCIEAPELLSAEVKDGDRQLSVRSGEQVFLLHFRQKADFPFCVERISGGEPLSVSLSEVSS